jgi:ParB family chromosome partitioning protein
MTTQTVLPQIRIDAIQADPNNARKTFDPAGLQELADSIREQGLIQPVTVRVTDAGVHQLIAGERRLRACQLLGMETIPAVVMDMDDKQATLAGLIENLQRADLDPFEAGAGYKHAMDVHGLSQQELATKLGKSKQAISAALARTRVDAGVRKQMLEAGWAAGSIDEVVSLGKDRQVELLDAFAGKAPTVKQIREAKSRESTEAVPTSGLTPFVTPGLPEKGKDGEVTELTNAIHQTTVALLRIGRTPKGAAALSSGPASAALRAQLQALLQAADKFGL